MADATRHRPLSPAHFSLMTFPSRIYATIIVVIKSTRFFCRKENHVETRPDSIPKMGGEFLAYERKIRVEALLSQPRPIVDLGKILGPGITKDRDDGLPWTVFPGMTHGPRNIDP